MSEMVYERAIPLADEDGRRFDLVRVHVTYWATGLEPICLEGALQMATARKRR